PTSGPCAGPCSPTTACRSCSAEPSSTARERGRRSASRAPRPGPAATSPAGCSRTTPAPPSSRRGDGAGACSPAQAPSNTARRRRWPIVVGAGVAVVALVAALVWFVGLPRYRPGLHDGERYGIDVSAHQGRISWSDVARDGISFAYVKATEGADFVDRSFAGNWTGARRVAVERGAYHFFTLCAPGGAQAQNFLRIVPDDADALAPAVDLELKGNCSRRPDAAAVRREVSDFL